MSGVMTYLVEELSDARLRCVQLKAYVDEAAKLVGKSTHRDHIFEVAGHLVEGIPNTLFKLEKALQATAMAASRVDYEELKQELKPEKAEELEQALQDVRIRYVQRRSGVPMTPQKASKQLSSIAASLRESKDARVAFDSLLEVLVGIEQVGPKPVTASEDKLAGQIEQLAKDLATQQKPNPGRYAAALRQIVLELMPKVHVAVMDQQALQQMASSVVQGNSRQEVMDGFMKANPNMSKEDAEKAADMWEKHKNVVKDKHADGSLPVPGEPPVFGEAAVEQGLVALVDHAKRAQMVGPTNSKRMFFLLLGVIDSLGVIGRAYDLPDVGFLMRVYRTFARMSGSKPTTNFASDMNLAEVEKESRFEEGKPADPTENMSPEDAKKWKTEHDKNKDNFKSASYPVNVLNKFPSGKWGFVGNVDVRLHFVAKDGSELTPEQAKEVAHASNPAMLAKTRVFSSPLEALQEAKRLHQKVTISPGDADNAEIQKAVKQSGHPNIDQQRMASVGDKTALSVRPGEHEVVAITAKDHRGELIFRVTSQMGDEWERDIRQAVDRASKTAFFVADNLRIDHMKAKKFAATDAWKVASGEDHGGPAPDTKPENFGDQNARSMDNWKVASGEDRGGPAPETKPEELGDQNQLANKNWKLGVAEQRRPFDVASEARKVEASGWGMLSRIRLTPKEVARASGSEGVDKYTVVVRPQDKGGYMVMGVKILSDKEGMMLGKALINKVDSKEEISEAVKDILRTMSKMGYPVDMADASRHRMA